MDQGKAERLRAARIKAGYETAADACVAFNWKVAGYRHHENGTRSFDLDAARKYARAFRVKPGWLVGMAALDDAPAIATSAKEPLTVVGSVAAGVWREPHEGFVSMEIDTPPPVEGAKRFGLTVDGHSMDLHYEPGTVLDCISIFPTGIEPQSGDHVIVERIKTDGLRETTVKEFVTRDGQFYLAPRSTRPEFQREIEIGAPSEHHEQDGEEVRVIGFVVSSISPRALRLLDRLGKVRRS